MKSKSRSFQKRFTWNRFAFQQPGLFLLLTYLFALVWTLVDKPAKLLNLFERDYILKRVVISLD